MKTVAIAATLAALTACAALPAHAGTFTAEANAAHADDTEGAELGLGYRFAAGNFRLTPIVGAFITAGEDDGRYRQETFDNGQTVCRDTSNGQFADKENCSGDLDVAAYGKVEASYRIGGKVEVGVGARFGEDDAVPYGTLAFGQVWGVKLAAGQDYYALGLTYGF